MITTDDYFGAKPHSPEQLAAAEALLLKVNTLLTELAWDWLIDSDTGTCISGSKGGQGDGGFRLETATTGRPASSHKEARGVDVFDPKGEIDELITDQILEHHGLYREDPGYTPGWCHLTDRAPGSGKRTFIP